MVGNWHSVLLGSNPLHHLFSAAQGGGRVPCHIERSCGLAGPSLFVGREAPRVFQEDAVRQASGPGRMLVPRVTASPPTRTA
jgi:hypothetical protein